MTTNDVLTMIAVAYEENDPEGESLRLIRQAG